jgi:hypothetical protein
MNVDALDELWEQLNYKSETSPRKRRKRPEAKVQKAIIQWLLAHRVILAVTDAGAAHRLGVSMGTGVPTGWPDLTCLFPGGYFVGIECKAPRGKQDAAQKTYQAAIEDRGGIYILAHSLEELIDALRKEMILGNLALFSLDTLDV